MAYAVEMYFDTESDRQIRHLWKELHDKNVSSYMFTSGSRPHISLSVLNSLDIPDFARKLKEFAEKLKPFEIRFGSIGVFPEPAGVLYLAPIVTEELLKVHNDFNCVFADYKNEMWYHYLPGIWMPHCTLATDIHKKDLPLALKYLLDSSLPAKARVEEIGIVEFNPIKHHESFRLQDCGG